MIELNSPNVQAIKKHGKRWREVAIEMGGIRKPASLRDHYTKYLDPTYDRSPFTEEDKQKILVGLGLSCWRIAIDSLCQCCCMWLHAGLEGGKCAFVQELAREEQRNLNRVRWSVVARGMPTKRVPFLLRQLYVHMLKVSVFMS